MLLGRAVLSADPPGWPDQVYDSLCLEGFAWGAWDGAIGTADGVLAASHSRPSHDMRVNGTECADGLWRRGSSAVWALDCVRRLPLDVHKPLHDSVSHMRHA